MPLNLSINDEDFVAYIKFNAKAGRWYVRPQGASEDVEVDRPRLAFDMMNIKTGWLYYTEGAGPEKIWDPSPTQMAPRPAGPRKFKRGFEVMVYGNDPIPGVGTLGLREFSSTANNVIGAIVQMYNEYEEKAQENPGNVPFYACTGVKAVAGTYGTNYEPRFELKAWVPRAKIPAFDGADRTLERAAPRGNGDGREAPPPRGEDDYYSGRSSRALGRANMDDEIPF